MTDTVEAIVAEMRGWATGEGCFNDTPDDKPLPCVYWAQTPFLAILDRLQSAHGAEVGALRARALELEAQRDDYLKREWQATKDKNAAESRLRETDEMLRLIYDCHGDHDEESTKQYVIGGHLWMRIGAHVGAIDRAKEKK